MSRPNNKHDRREKDNKNNINQDRASLKRIIPYKRPKSNRNYPYILPNDGGTADDMEDYDDEDITDG